MTNSQKLKKEILKNLTDWCFDPLGDLVSSKSLMNRTYQNENSYHFRYYSDDKLNPNWRTEPQTNPAELTLADYQEVKEAMINEIFQSPHDWKIEKENDLTVIKHKVGRKNWKSKFSEGFQQGFKENEWKEIENALKGKQQDNYNNCDKDRLIAEINRLKAENEQLKNNQTLTVSERQERLQQNQQKLEQVMSYISVDSKSNNSNNDFPTGWVVGGGILSVVGLMALVFIRKSRKSKVKK